MAQQPKHTVTKTTKRATAQRPSGGKKSAAQKAATAAAVAGAAAVISKKVNGKTIAIAVIALIIAFGIGVGACFILSKNDRFDIVGQDEITLQLSESYKDQGVDIREYGIDLSGKAKVEADPKLKTDENGEYYADEVGTYYIKYTVSSLKFGFVYKIQKVRLLTFVEESESGE